MTLDPKLLSILACPQDKGPLVYVESESVLVNPRLKLSYRIDQNIPVMLVDEAASLEDAEVDRLVALAGSES